MESASASASAAHAGGADVLGSLLPEGTWRCPYFFWFSSTDSPEVIWWQTSVLSQSQLSKQPNK